MLKKILCWFLSIFIVNLFSLTIGKIALIFSHPALSAVVVIILCLLLLKIVQRINSLVVFSIMKDFETGIKLMKISGIWIVIFQIINIVTFAYEPSEAIFTYLSNLVFGIIYWIGYGKTLEDKE